MRNSAVVVRLVRALGRAQPAEYWAGIGFVAYMLAYHDGGRLDRGDRIVNAFAQVNVNAVIAEHRGPDEVGIIYIVTLRASAGGAVDIGGDVPGHVPGRPAGHCHRR